MSTVQRHPNRHPMRFSGSRRCAFAFFVAAASILFTASGCSVDPLYRSDTLLHGQTPAERTLREARSGFPTPPRLSASDLEEITRTGFKGLDWTWLAEGPLLPPHRSPSGTGTHLTEGYIQGLLTLNASGSARDQAALRRIRSSLASMKPARADSPLAQMVLAARLATYDEETWVSFVRDFARLGRKDAALKDSLVPVLQAMPTPLRDRLYKQLNNAPLRNQLDDPLHAYFRPGLYEWAMANKKGVTAGCIQRRSDGDCQKMAPKRCIYAFLRGTIRVEEHFRREATHSKSEGSALKPESVLKAYESYLAAQRHSVFQNSLVGKYTAQDVVAILSGVRASLAGKWPRRAPDLSAYGHDKNPFLLAFGSIVNGRGVLDRNPNFKVKFQEDGSYTLNDESFSDFDMYASPVDDLKVIRQHAAQAYSFLRSPLTSVQQADENLRARFQIDAYEQHQELNSALLSPVSIRLDEQGVYLLLYPVRRYSDIPHSRAAARKLALSQSEAGGHLGKIRCFALSGSCPSVYSIQESR